MRHSGVTSRGVFKATGLFGGTQVASVLGSVLRTKLVAIWVGEAGIGLFGLLNAAVEFVGAVSQLGVRSSAVRDISEAASASSGTMVPRIVMAVRRWGWALGLLGAVIMIAASPLMAHSFFGSYSKVWPFLLLSLAVFLNSASEAEKAVLQGLRLFSPLARASMWGVVAGCIVSVPVIYVWRIDGVAFVILGYSMAAFIATWCCRAKGVRQNVPMNAVETIKTGLGFVKLGFFMTVSSIFAWGTNLLFLTYLNTVAGTDALGCYQAGYTLTVRYVAFIFTAIGMEYYPRMAAAAPRGAFRMQVFMRHEVRILLLMITAVSAVMAAFAPWVVRILYSSSFQSTVWFVMLATPGLLFRAASWCVAFVILSKGDGAAYLACEVASVLIGLALNVGGYYLAGVPGIGLSFSLWYLVYFVVVAAVVSRRYNIMCGRRMIAMLAVCVTAVSATVSVAFLYGWIAAAVMAMCLCAVCARGLLRLR